MSKKALQHTRSSTEHAWHHDVSKQVDQLMGPTRQHLREIIMSHDVYAPRPPKTILVDWLIGIAAAFAVFIVLWMVIVAPLMEDQARTLSGTQPEQFQGK
jgi:hypothetical protein